MRRVRRLPESARACALALALVSLAVSPPAAQQRVSGSAAWDMERALIEMERLQAEVAVLRRLGEVQAELLAWNRERADSGAGPAVLAARLCAEPELAAWCRALPATFGPDAAETAVNGNGKDGER